MTANTSDNEIPTYRVRNLPRAAWSRVTYTDMHDVIHVENWACSFCEAEDRLREINATNWGINT